MAIQTTFKNDLLDAAFRGQTYTGGTIQIGLFKTGLPSTTGVEVSGGSYARQTATFSVASGGSITLSSNVTFTNLPTSGTIVAFGVYDDGVLIDEDTLSTPFTPDVTNNELEINYTFAL